MIRAVPSSVARAMVATAMAVLTACSDTPTRPQLSARALTPSFSTGGAVTATRFPNTIKYRDTGAKPATGRSGSASLEARALLGKNLETVLEVTTGSLEGAQVPPGNLDKVQVKLFDPQWHELSTRNYSSLSGGGYASYTYTALPRGSGVQVQANVGGIDANRTDVVTVRGNVYLRPDLAATEITAPDRAQLGVPVQISGRVRELNGDVGARADCVLSVDGVRVASAEGIWVDHDGDVSCAFTHVFPTTGTKTLEVSVVNVAPWDYDVANNARTATIDVVSDVPGARFSAEANDWTESFDFQFDWLFRQTFDGSGALHTHEEHWDAQQSDNWQNGLMFGYMRREIPFPVRGVQFSNTSGGNVIAAKDFGTLEPTQFQDDDLVRIACVNHFTPLDANQGYVQVGICSGVLWYAGGEPYLSFTLHRQHGEVLYVAISSSGNNRFDYPDGSSETYPFSYVYNFSQPRTLPRYGADLTIDFSFEAGGEIYRNTAAVPMTAFDRQFPNEPHNCSEYTKPQSMFDYEKVCSSRSNWRRWGVEGRMMGTGTIEPAGVAVSP